MSVEEKLHQLTSILVEELISLTPESMTKIQFEIVATPDGGADIGLIETHEDAKHVALSDTIYSASSQYLPLVKEYLPGWNRTLITITSENGSWNVNVDLDHSDH